MVVVATFVASGTVVVVAIVVVVVVVAIALTIAIDEVVAVALVVTAAVAIIATAAVAITLEKRIISPMVRIHGSVRRSVGGGSSKTGTAAVGTLEAGMVGIGIGMLGSVQ